jgi:hypothetical protein
MIRVGIEITDSAVEEKAAALGINSQVLDAVNTKIT